MELKLKKCKCGTEFKQYNSLQSICVACAILKAKTQVKKDTKNRTKDYKKEKLTRKSLLTKNDYAKKAQTSFNKFIRERDKDLPCISCGKFHQGKYDAGHYKTTKSYPELRYHPFNNNKQCQPCNRFLSGNIIEYRKMLIKKIGIKNVNWIEGDQKLQKLTIDDYIDIDKYYKERYKFLSVEG